MFFYRQEKASNDNNLIMGYNSINQIHVAWILFIWRDGHPELNLWESLGGYNNLLFRLIFQVEIIKNASLEKGSEMDPRTSPHKDKFLPT